MFKYLLQEPGKEYSNTTPCRMTYLQQGYTNFPTVKASPLNSWCQKSDMKQFSYRRPRVVELPAKFSVFWTFRLGAGELMRSCKCKALKKLVFVPKLPVVTVKNNQQPQRPEALDFVISRHMGTSVQDNVLLLSSS